VTDGNISPQQLNIKILPKQLKLELDVKLQYQSTATAGTDLN